MASQNRTRQRRSSFRPRRRYGTPYLYQLMEMQYAQRRLIHICIALILIPLLLCGISYWGILLQGIGSGGEYAGVYVPRLIAALVAFLVAAVFSVLYAWNADEYTFAKSLPASYIICTLGMFVGMLILPIELPGIAGGSMFLGLARFVVNCVLAISGGALPALIASGIGWLVRTGYFLLRPED